MKAENIYVEINDSVSEVVEKIINSQSETVILIIPENAKISESILNFRLIKREALTANKKLFISSDAEEVLLMAKESAIKIAEMSQLSRPKVKNKILIGDIKPPKRAKATLSTQPKETIFDGFKTELKKRVKEKESDISDIEQKDKRFFTDYFDQERFNKIEISEKEIRRERPKRIKIRMGKFGRIVLGAILTLFIITFVFIYFLAKAEINIVSNKFLWEEQMPVLATEGLVEVDEANFKIPLTAFEFSRTISETFLATEIKNIESKAKGIIRIYNAYSSNPQTLVATTRFMTTDGKIFRLINQIVVPGAKVEDGKIIPSYIDAEVIADKAGESYNIGPTKFTIPGFQGTPRYEKFYGESLKPMIGGYIGQTKIVGQSDIENAKKKILDIAGISLIEELKAKISPTDILLEDAKELILSNVTTSPKLGEKADEFQINAKVILRALIFKEEYIKQIFVNLATKENLQFKNKELFNCYFNYGIPRIDFDRKLLSFPVSAKLIFRDKVNTDEFKNQLSGKNIKELEGFFKYYNNIEKININIWPKFLKFMPLNEKRIKITLDE